ncbi:MAG: hypothetical protein AABX70_07470 [Nanoarchaeota archaeon]
MPKSDEISRKFNNKLRRELGEDEVSTISTRQYDEFKEAYLPKHLSFYESACNFSESLLHLQADKKNVDDLKEAIDICHIDITPAGVTSFAILAPMIYILVGGFLVYLLPSLLSAGEGGSLFLLAFVIFTGIIAIFPLLKLPDFLANSWRIKASNQMVLSIFYTVTYMRHTSNLEGAIRFAAEHLSPPLSLDLKRVIWNIETEKYSSLKESMDNYLLTWRKYNPEFIESMHLVESSLYEGSESRRLDALDKSLKVILEETFEKLLHYAHSLKTPLTTLNMLGIILPILGLVILPLMVSFLPDVRYYHLMVIYDLALPFGVYYLGRKILSQRPTGYGDTDLAEQDRYKKYDYALINLGGTELKISPALISFFVFFVFFLIGITPLLVHVFKPNFDAVIGEDGLYTIEGISDSRANHYFLGYRKETINGVDTGRIVGPFGLGATLLSLFIPISIGLSLSTYYSLRSRNLIAIREASKKLELEFASALFQLGNRLADGIPAEMAFDKVANSMEGTLSGKFFKLVSSNISRLGYGLEQAIFDSKQGALVYYPSNLIESSMKVLVESSRKGPIVASQALISVAEYIKEIHRVDERLKDLLGEVISSMKGQVAFLTPAIGGIVIGITSMITKILGSLSERLTSLASEATSQGGGSILSIFGTGVPTYYFQVIVGVYICQITFILTQLINGIENGEDILNERYSLGKNMKKTIITYVIISAVIMLVFNLIAGTVIGTIAT